jgi:toxin YoeB
VRIAFTPRGWDDYTHWQSNDRAILRRLNRLIEAAARAPREGLGHPEPLKYRLGEVWSRRITEADRLVYLIERDAVVVLQARFHYDD